MEGIFELVMTPLNTVAGLELVESVAS